MDNYQIATEILERALRNLNTVCAAHAFYCQSQIEGATQMSNAVMTHYARIVCRAHTNLIAIASVE